MKNLAHEVRSDGSHHTHRVSTMASLYLIHMSKAHQAAVDRVEDRMRGIGECCCAISEVSRRHEIRRSILDRTKVNFANLLRGLCCDAHRPAI